MKKIEAAILASEYIRETSVLDCNVIVCDSEARILHFLQARTFEGDFKVGEIASAGLVKDVISEKQTLKRIIPEKVYGVKLKAIVSPIIEEDGSLSGIVGTATNLEAQDTLHTASQSIAATSEEIAATTQELSASAFSLAESLMTVRTAIEKVKVEISKTDEILKFVNEVADNSNLLGLNAAIEAARAGEQGMGFSVVADKIRKMAENSSDSVKDIRRIVQTIQKETNSVLEMVKDVTELGQKQAAATEEIESAMQHLTTAAADIEKVAEVI
jgi:methyl-accepting chemotaxis protein